MSNNPNGVQPKNSLLNKEKNVEESDTIPKFRDYEKLMFVTKYF